MTQPDRKLSSVPQSAEEKITKLGDFFVDDLDELRDIPVEALVPDPHQDRTDWASEASVASLQELAESMKATRGNRTPIVVKPLADGRFLINTGERRWRAAKIAGLKTILCLIRKKLEDNTAAIDMFVENIVRADLNHIEVAHAIQRRLDAGIPRKQLIQISGKSEAWISKRLALLKLPPDIQQLAISRQIREIEVLIQLGKMPDEERKIHLDAINAGNFDANKVRVTKKPKSAPAKSAPVPAISLSPYQIAYILRKIGHHHKASDGDADSLQQAFREFLAGIPRPDKS
jgi:ParB family chromosome partitioning protein